MRTKNTKRLWPVPATLAVVALAAFLAFGLMATTGSQPAEAQSKTDCEVTATITVSNNVVTVDPTVTDNFIGTPEDCQAKGDTATVKFTGPIAPVAGLDAPGKLELLIQDDRGPIRAYLNGHVAYSTSTNRYEITSVGEDAMLGTQAGEAPAPMRFRHEVVDVPLAARDADLQYEAQSTIITVSGNIYIYASGDALTTGIPNVPPTSSDKRNQLVTTGDTVVIKFLGAPALGKDGDDANKIVDDVMQCQDTSTPPMTAERDSNATGCTDGFVPDDDDAPESKSKLIAIGGVDPTAVLDAKSADHILISQSKVTIYALIKDAKGQALPGTEVNFLAAIEPMGLELDFDEDRDVNAKVVGIAADEDEIAISSVDGIVDDDAVAVRVIDGLPTDKAYRITVNVTVGSLDLGSIVVTRHGDPAEIKAAVYNEACITPVGTDDGYANDRINLDNDDCAEDYRFGEGQVVVVKAHLEDTLGSVVSGNLSVKLDDVAKPLDTDKPVEITQPIATNENPVAWVYVVDKAAMLGPHMTTVSTTETDKDENAINDVTLTVTVAGPVDDYMLDGPSVIDLGGAEEYTVTAVDVNGGVPHIITGDGNDANDLVYVAVQPVTTLVTGLTASSQLKLDPETGMGSFTVYAALNALHGDAGRIIVGPSDNLTILSISFGENRAPMAGMAIADQMVDAGSMVMVQSNFSDLDGDMLSYMAMSDMMDVATASVDDMGMVTITGVAMGTATITVTATDPDGMYAMQTIMVTVEAADTSLQDIPDSSIDVTNNANSSITVNWMGGDNADSFIVVAAELGSDPFTYELKNVADGAARMATISGLNSSSSYIIIVIALQGSNFEYGVSQIVMAN